VKNIYFFILFIYLLFSILPTHAQKDDYFIVTAYYSPLPDQDYYITGNYKDDIILNGQ
jgi:hypothetical protein